jgi:hypothetical protein
LKHCTELGSHSSYNKSIERNFQSIGELVNSHILKSQHKKNVQLRTHVLSNNENQAPLSFQMAVLSIVENGILWFSIPASHQEPKTENEYGGFFPVCCA